MLWGGPGLADVGRDSGEGSEGKGGEGRADTTLELGMRKPFEWFMDLADEG